MGLEIERKFLLRNDAWRQQVLETIVMRQGYLSSAKDRTVRVRVAGQRGFLTIKGRSVGAVRPEYEYEIPVGDAEEMIGLCEQPVIGKTRYVVGHLGNSWEVDVFEGDNEGLVVAEIELTSEGEYFHWPSWLGEEVTDDPRYFNSSLVSHPYKDWSGEAGPIGHKSA